MAPACYDDARPPTGVSLSLALPSLKLEYLLGRVAQLLQDSRQLSLVPGALFGSRDGLHQARRAADEDLGVFRLGLGQHRLQQLLGDEALAASPALGRVVEERRRRGTAADTCFSRRSNSCFRRMSSWLMLPKTSVTWVLSSGLLKMARHSWYMGVMPVPAGHEGDVGVLVCRPRVLRL